MSRFRKKLIDFYLIEQVETESLLQLAKKLSNFFGTIFLYSGSDFDSSKKSYLWAFPYDAIVVRNGKLYRNGTCIWVPDMWRELKNQVQGGTWAGFLGYEMGLYGEAQLAHLFKQGYTATIPTDDLYLQRSCFEAIYDHKSKRLQVTIDRKASQKLAPHFARLLEQLTAESLRKIMLQAMLQTTLQARREQPTVGRPHILQPFETFESYEKKFEQVQEAIRSGDVYQLNLSHEVAFTGHFRAFSLFLEQVKKNSLSFFSFLRLPEYSIVSASPERFLQRQAGVLETRPIKGTRPRGKTEAEDRALCADLVHSEKEASELIMIVDLMRNDLAKVSEPASVEVKELFRTEAYRHIFHRVSIIQAKSKLLHPIEILQKTFPGGSVTGCPKMSAMKLIASLEKRRRGIYTGAIGYIKEDGDFDFSMAIRTAVLTASKLALAVGGGIVIDSEAQTEYLETKYKAESLLEVLRV